jgi:hypothetical protein
LVEERRLQLVDAVQPWRSLRCGCHVAREA